MITVRGERVYSYPIQKTENLFDPGNDTLLSFGDAHPGARRFVIIDKNVYRLYREPVERYFSERGIHANLRVVDAGDGNKSEGNYLSVFGDLCEFDLKRRSEPVIAIGGGVITDLAGFVASTYRRGVPHIKVPTTLMGYVDASVGIKTGVNYGPFKNRMGSFEIPAGVLLDRTFLQTLDRRNLLNGLGEIVKLAVILDEPLFNELERNPGALLSTRFQDENGEHILDRSILGMVGELAPNLYEGDLQRKVDFGHTFSLAIESASGYEVMHGEAVAVDVLFSSYLSLQRGLFPAVEFSRMVALFRALELPMWDHHITPQRLWEGVEERVMHRDGKQLIPLPTRIGGCTFINDLRREEIRDAVNELEKRFTDRQVA